MKPDRVRPNFVDSFWELWLPLAVFATLLFGIKIWLIGTYGNATPYWDQWDAEAANLYKPFLEGTLGWTDLLAPHNEHRIFTTRVLALALLTVNGIWNPLLQMVVNAVLHIVTLGVGIVMLTRVVGRHHLPALLAFALILFGIPYAWENTLAGFQSQFYFVLLFSIACLWLAVTADPLSGRWWLGIICAVFAFFSLASGIFTLAAGAIVGLALYISGLRQTRKQLFGVGILFGLFVFGALLTPSLAYHAPLKAASLRQLYEALLGVLAWPLSPNFQSAFVRNLPALVFVGVLLRTRPPAADRRWFLLALVVWTFGQAVSVAYGRAVGNLSSRYLDLFAMGILVNFACLISIVQSGAEKRLYWRGAALACWLLTVFMSLGRYANEHVWTELSSKLDIGRAQESNTRNYLASGDLKHLQDKPYLHVPYPDSKRLASILESPSIMAILPTNIRSPLTPVLIESQPTDAFVVNGFYPTTPKRNNMTLGSYGAQGDATKGQVTMSFESNERNAVLAIPVAGYPLSSGVKLEVEQNGQRIPVVIERNPKESWGTGYAKVSRGEFSIHMTDSSNTAWLSVGAPSIGGRLDGLVNRLLANYLSFVMLGVAGGVLLMTQCRIPKGITKPVKI